MSPSLTLRSLTLASVLSHSDNRRICGFAFDCAQISASRTVNRKICQNLSSRRRKRVISLKNLKFRYQISGINLVEKKEMERLERNEKNGNKKRR